MHRNAYVPDAIATWITFSSSGLAASTSQNYWQCPEDVTLIDISGAAPTAVGATLTIGGAPYVGKTFRWANQLATLSKRMTHAIPFRAGQQIGALQF